MLGYTDAHDFQGVNQWIYGRIYDPSMHHDPAISEADWLDTMFRGVTVNSDTYTLTWYNITGVESFSIYAFESRTESNPANAAARVSMPAEHDIYLASQWNVPVSFSLSRLGLEPGSTYYLRIQGIPQQVPVRGQEPLMWGEPTPLSNPVQATGQDARDVQFRLTLGSTNIVNQLTGATRAMEVAPLLEDSRTLVPARYVAESLGGEVSWDPDAQEVTIVLDGVSLSIIIGEMAPGMDVPARIDDGRTMVPLRFIVEYFGAEAFFDEGTGVIDISK